MRDYAAPWFRVRRQQGVDDTIHYGIVEPGSGRRHGFTIRHEQVDGVGAFMHLLRRLPLASWQGVEGRPGVIPGLWQCWRQQVPGPQYLAPQWRHRDPAPDARQEQISLAWLTVADTAALRQQARAQRASLNALLLESCHEVVARHLLHGEAGTWFIPVTLRGSLRLPRDEMNHASGVYLPLPSALDMTVIHERIAAALKRNEHWWLWHQSRLVVSLGGHWLVRQVLRGLGKRRYLGSFSSMGEWQIDWRGSAYEDNALMWACPPGSPNYPVAVCWLICNGRLVLNWKLNASLGVSAARSEAMLQEWQQRLLARIPPSTTATLSFKESCHA